MGGEAATGTSLSQADDQDVTVRTLLRTEVLALRDVRCRGGCRHGPEECAERTELVVPYHGVFARTVGRRETIAEPNQMVFFNGGEAYRVGHPVGGGDACLSLAIEAEILRELTPAPLLRRGPEAVFEPARIGVSAGAQRGAAHLRHRLRGEAVETLAAEGAVLAWVRAMLEPRDARAPAGTPGRQRIVDRAKLVLASDLARRWTLSDVAAQTGGSPVYLTQVFKAVEGVPLYQYQVRLRLARALELIPRADDLTDLALDLGFSSHSQFTAAFRKAYGLTPSAFRAETR